MFLVGIRSWLRGEELDDRLYIQRCGVESEDEGESVSRRCLLKGETRQQMLDELIVENVMDKVSALIESLQTHAKLHEVTLGRLLGIPAHDRRQAALKATNGIYQVHQALNQKAFLKNALQQHALHLHQNYLHKNALQ